MNLEGLSSTRLPDAQQLLHCIRRSSGMGAQRSMNNDWSMEGWAAPSGTEAQDIINVDEKQWVVEEGLKGKEQFCTVEGTGILVIIREEQRISNSKEHKLGIRNTTASSAAAWEQTNWEKPVFMHCRVFCREDWRPLIFWWEGFLLMRMS